MYDLETMENGNTEVYTIANCSSAAIWYFVSVGLSLLVVEMTKRVNVQKQVKGACKGLPFKSDGNSRSCGSARSVKAKQRSWMLNGLKAMNAPIAPSFTS